MTDEKDLEVLLVRQLGYRSQAAPLFYIGRLWQWWFWSHSLLQFALSISEFASQESTGV